MVKSTYSHPFHVDPMLTARVIPSPMSIGSISLLVPL